MTRPGMHVALLRGINVGGKHKLLMRELAGFFEEAGCADVATYIQSGNVVFAANATHAQRIPALIHERIAAELDFDVPVVTRSASELRRVVKRNPYAGEDEKTLHVAFLGARPTSEQVQALDPDRSPGDAFTVVGREVYLHLPHGVARTKLTNAWLDSRLGTVSTARNWRTTQRLLAMMEHR